MTEERRQEPRIDAQSLNLFVHDNLDGKLLGSLVNLSQSGLMILANVQSEPGGILQLDLRNTSSPDTPVLSMGVKVCWISPAKTEDSYWIGARIIGIAPADAEKLGELLRKAESGTAT